MGLMNSKTKRINGTMMPRSLAEAAWLEIREQILTGVLSPGQPIDIREQAESLGISMMPVREAVKKLHQEGLIIQKPHRGSIVAPLSVHDMEDIYRVRIALEGLAAEMVCDRIDQVTYKKLCEVLDQFESASRDGDIDLGRQLHRKFHVDFCTLAGSDTLNRLIPNLIDSSERYRIFSVGLRGSVDKRRKEHQEFLDSCYRKEREKARNQITEHLRKTVELVRKSLSGGDVSLEIE
jgi:DNA-binding GntR family transcriptional regulator